MSASELNGPQTTGRTYRNLSRPRFGIRRFNRQLLTLHQLDDAAVLEVDGGNQHQRRTGMPFRCRYFFSSLTLDSA